MNRKERVCAYISSKEYIPLTADELAAVLCVPADARDELNAILDELCGENRIYITKKRRYMPYESERDTVTGKLVCNAKGYFGFVSTADRDDIFVKGDDMNGAFSGDEVVVRLIGKAHNGHDEGRVIRIVSRGNSIVVGEFYSFNSGYSYLRPDNRRLYTKIKVEDGGTLIGKRAAVEITEYTDKEVFGRVIMILGDTASAKSYVEGIILEHNIKQEFDEETIIESKKIRDRITKKAAEGRTDLRNKLIFTIDGDHAKDFDDAVSLEMLDNGNYMLGVHIADVTHFVTEDSALDNEAFERGTSVYLADRVIPMLPEKLSNGVCSLNPDKDRLTLSAIMEIDKNGTVVSYSIEKTIIHSKARMTYNNVTKILEGDKELREKYSFLVPTLEKMHELSDILEKMRSTRGAIDFDFPETSVLVDKKGEPIEIVGDERGISNKIIEEFMLTANETIAEYAYWSELPFVYRTHEPPSSDKIESFNKFIAHFGLTIKGKIDSDNPVHPKALQNIMEAVKGTPEERMVASTMLHSLMKAEYKSENLGHFGLSAKYYCHFTSPIRRYPDLIIHRILKEFIDGNFDEKRVAHYTRIAELAAQHSSETEINAEYAERDVDDLMKTVYMSAFVGAEFKAVIANTTNFGMFAELENSVEGLIRMENMNGDYFEYDEKTSSLIGKRTGKTYRIGDEINVVLMKTDIVLRQIDFMLSEDATDGMFRKFKPKAIAEKKGRRTSGRRKFVKRKKRNGR